MAYVDEGNFLHSAFTLIRDGGWDPRSYLYPQFPVMVVTAVARLVDPLYRLARGHSMREQIPKREELYDDLEPFAILALARGVNVVLGMAIVVLTGALARRLGGPQVGAVAALVAAVTPALVLRASIASVDSYSAFFVLTCLYLTDLTRTSKYPRLLSLAAGAAAGVAFGSKYPAVLVIGAFGVSTLLSRVAVGEKAARLAAATAGVVAGAVAAMPALVAHASDVYAAIRMQATMYGEIPSPPLWKQALLRAEWDIWYERSELGIVFVVLAVVGLVAGLRTRQIRSTLWGWVAFMAACLFVYGRQVFQPFRNLLPLVPISCIAVALALAALRHRFPRRRLIEGLAAGWMVVAFLLPLSRYAIERHRLADPRKLAMDWLTRNARADDDVLIVRELGFLNQELGRLQTRQTVRWWDDAPNEIVKTKPRFIVVGVFERPSAPTIDAAALPVIRDDYVVRFRLGYWPTVAVNGYWRSNYQIVSVMERVTR
jgi:hypothetical protein